MVVFAFLPLMQKSQEELALNSPSATLCPGLSLHYFGSSLSLSLFYFILFYFFFFFFCFGFIFFFFSLSSLFSTHDVSVDKS